MSFRELIAELSKYIDVSSDMQIGAIEYACSNDGRIDVRELSSLLNLSYKQTLDLMTRLRKRGLVVRRGVGLYFLTKKGRMICELMGSFKSSIPPFKLVKLLLLVGSRLKPKISVEKLMRYSGLGREDLVEALSEFGDFVLGDDGKEYFELNREGEERFADLIKILGIGPTTIKIMTFFTRSREPSSALFRFLLLHLIFSIIIIYDVFAAKILGALAAILWIFITIIFIILLGFKK